jgi:hypothetical protein
MITKPNLKKNWLDKLYYEVGKQQYDFFLCGTYEKKGETLFSKWKLYSEAIFPTDFDGTCDNWKVRNFFEQINQRQILPIEIVLDIEEKERIKPIVKMLEKWKWEYSIWNTGSRGYHIHLIFKEELNQEEKKAVVKKLGTDMQKCSDKCLIALEYENHWKSGKPKQLISKGDILNG